MLGWILGFSMLGSAGALGVASIFLKLDPQGREQAVPPLLSFATGTLLGAAFLGLLPEALELARPDGVFSALLAGFVAFFVLEKAVLWHHCQHDAGCVEHLDHHLDPHRGHAAAGPLILIGDAIHKFVDGVVIATSFMVSVPMGVATSLAIVAHEIPHQVGDFAILLKSGFTAGRALRLSLLSALVAVVGAVAAYFFLSSVQPAVPYLMAFAASGFIYIAVSDLVPGLHKFTNFWHSALQVALIVAGMVTIALLKGGHAH
ncbi:MAG: ZIP family metal transporter [Bdellovibrionales bacterium]|nr:ZIP family metal transporter [Bdellovibrionales bacterium]